MIKSINSAAGFGDYARVDAASYDAWMRAEKVKAVARIVLAAIAFAASLCLTILFPPAAVLTAGTSLLLAKAIADLMGILNRTPPIDYLFDPTKTAGVLPCNRLDSEGNYSALLPKDSVESFEWKCKLIRHAEKSIVFSGCYAGGESFDRLLVLIEERMEEKPELQVSLLASAIFVTPENKERIARLQKKHPARFLNVTHGEMIPYHCPAGRNVLTTNHTKALVIDGGAYFVVGGSGVVSFFTNNSGLERPHVAENLCGPFSGFMPAAYRDMDFVFHSPAPNGLGARLHMEMSKLVEIYRRREAHPRAPCQELPDPTQTHIPEFDEAKKSTQLAMAVLPSGPEHSVNSFEEAMVQQIEETKESIFIAHLYFTPSRRVLNALIQAARRGVKITILTNKAGRQNPYMNEGIVNRARYCCKRLLEGRPNPNVKIYQYDVPKVTLHKKVMVFDNKSVLAGSGNLGVKSLDRHDYEIDFLVQSPAFAGQVLELLQKDLCHSVLLSDEAAARPPLAITIMNYGLEPFKGVF